MTQLLDQLRFVGRIQLSTASERLDQPFAAEHFGRLRFPKVGVR